MTPTPRLLAVPDLPASGWREEPTSLDRLRRMENRLRTDYINGVIEVEEFEERVDHILRGDPKPVDMVRATEIDPDEIRFGPGMLIPVGGPTFERLA